MKKIQDIIEEEKTQQIKKLTKYKELTKCKKLNKKHKQTIFPDSNEKSYQRIYYGENMVRITKIFTNT